MQAYRCLLRGPVARFLSLIVLLALLLALYPQPGLAQEEAFDICPSGCRYASIQQGINAAAPGVTLRIGAGTYRESITLRPRVSLLGAGAGSTVISGSGNQPVITAADGAIGRNTVVEKLSVTGGGGQSGGGVSVRGGASPTLRDLTIYGNSVSSHGGGVAVGGSSQPLLEALTMRGNAAVNGAGLFISGGASVTLNGGRIENNTAGNLGGAISVEGSTLTLDGAVMNNNSGAYGGGLSLSTSTVTLRNCTFQANTGQQYGGAVRVHGNSQFTVESCRFVSNRAPANTGGAIFSDKNSLQVSNSVFEDNQAQLGAAIHLHFVPLAVLQGNTFARNRAMDGAGVYMSGGQARLLGNTFTDNAASRFGGGFVAQDGALADLSFNQVLRNTAGIDGGGIIYQAGARGSIVNNVISFNRATEVAAGLKLYANVQPTVTHNRFEGNQADDGAAIQIEENANPLVENNQFIGNVANKYGGAVVVNILANPTIRYNAFVGNRAGLSGGAVVINDRSNAVFRFNTVSGNSANVAGGVLVMGNSHGEIGDNTISRNVANEHGGGLYLVDSNARVTGNQILDNQANGLGGGVVVINAAPTLENNLVARNRANSGGAGVYIGGGQATLRHNTIVSNGRGQNGDGVLLSAGASPALIYNVIVGNERGIRSSGGQPRQAVRNNLFDNPQGNYVDVTPGASDLLSDPQFISGPRGAYYLAQPTAGQPGASPLIDACSETAQALGLHLSTTRTDGINDQGKADIGYHFVSQPSRAFLPLVRLSR